MKHSPSLAFAAFAALGAFCAFGADGAGGDASGTATPHCGRPDPVEWLFPRTGSCHEGMAFADGVTGVLVWGGGDTVNLTVGRADLWDHRGGYPWTDEQSYTNIVAAVRADDAARLYGLFKKEVPTGEPRNPTLLPLGRIVLTIPGAELLRGELNPFTGLATLDFRLGCATNRAEMSMSRASRCFAMHFPPGVAFSAAAVPAMAHPAVRDVLAPVGFKDATLLDDPTGANCGFTWAIPGENPVSLVCRRDGRNVAVRAIREDGRGGAFTPYDAVATESVAQWAAFWHEGATVEVPDPVLQRAFDYGMYRFGAMTDPTGVPAGLQGPWLEDDRLVPWNGDYHFNVNVQACYSPAFRSGHFAHLMPLFRMILSWRGALRDNARRFAGIEDGYVLPHSVDDRGTCIGGFWTGTIDHGSTAWAADMMWRYVSYSGDVEFLREAAFDFMKGAMNVYLAMMEERGGRLSIPLAPSPEWGADDVRTAVGRDPSFQLALAHRLARDLLAAAVLVGEAPDPAWADVEARLPVFARGDGGIAVFDGVPFTRSHRHHSHLAGLFPFDVIDVAAEASAVDAAAERWRACGHGRWTGWCVPWAAVLHTHFGDATAAAGALRDWNGYFCNEGHGSHHDALRPGYTLYDGRPGIMQMDGACGAATAVIELLVHDVNGRARWFRGCPPEWRRVAFANVALPGGRRASGTRIDGKTEIHITGPK